MANPPLEIIGQAVAHTPPGDSWRVHLGCHSIHSFVSLPFIILDTPSFEYPGRVVQRRIFKVRSTVNCLARFGMTKIDRCTPTDESQSHYDD